MRWYVKGWNKICASSFVFLLFKLIFKELNRDTATFLLLTLFPSVVMHNSCNSSSILWPRVIPFLVILEVGCLRYLTSRRRLEGLYYKRRSSSLLRIPCNCNENMSSLWNWCCRLFTLAENVQCSGCKILPCNGRRLQSEASVWTTKVLRRMCEMLFLMLTDL